jgi:hypothetical protein
VDHLTRHRSPVAHAVDKEPLQVERGELAQPVLDLSPGAATDPFLAAGTGCRVEGADPALPTTSIPWRR